MIEAKPLAATIFWNFNFVLCFRHIFNLARKLGFKIKRLKTKVVNKQIEKIWTNRIIAKLDLLFTNNSK